MTGFIKAGPLFSLLLILPLLSGCTPEKAKALQAGAQAFDNQANEAVASIDAALMAEVTSPAPTAAEQATNFVRTWGGQAMTPQQQGKIDWSRILRSMDPGKVNLDPAVLKQKQDFLNGLRGNYAQFAAMFTNLAAGSFLAQHSVAEARDVATKLIADMAAAGQFFQQHPPQLLVEQDAVMAEVIQTNQSSQTADQKTAALTALASRVVDIQNRQATLLQDVTKQTAKAVSLGLDVRTMIEQYDQLDVGALQNLLIKALTEYGEFTGRDVASLSAKADALFARINDDAVLKGLVDDGLARLSTATAP